MPLEDVGTIVCLIRKQRQGGGILRVGIADEGDEDASVLLVQLASIAEVPRGVEELDVTADQTRLVGCVTENELAL